MRIAIDGRYIQDHFPGIGRYTFLVLSELARQKGEDELILFYNPHLINTRFDLGQLTSLGVVLRSLDIPPLSWRGQLSWPALARREMLDLFHSPHASVPLFLPCPVVVTVHDLTPLHSPRYLPSLLDRVVYRLATYLAVRLSRIVLADSLATKADLERVFPAVSKKIRAVYLGTDLFVSKPRNRPPQDSYFLYVGTNKPHKNLVSLVMAYARTKKKYKLLIAGKMDRRFPGVPEMVEKLGLGAQVHLLGAVAEGMLHRLYQEAGLFLFPSLAEGFGLPVLEAMAWGVPVISSNTTSLPEVVGDSGLLIDPLDIDRWAMAMDRVMDDQALYNDLSRRGLERARLFPWQKTAQGCLDAYREALWGG
ncbi:MAG: glycosyltransferase family 4 protein [Chloroflexi bacterium]|nr:glycosyltransferase family 4 protein [Chloroflexota bacterium]